MGERTNKQDKMVDVLDQSQIQDLPAQLLHALIPPDDGTHLTRLKVEETQLLPQQLLLSQTEGALVSETRVDQVLVVSQSQQDLANAVVWQVSHLDLTIVTPLVDGET